MTNGVGYVTGVELAPLETVGDVHDGVPPSGVYADPEDLAIIKEAAKRCGISEAEIIRQGIHLAAMANRVWDEPLFSRTFRAAGRTPGKRDVRDAVADAVRRETGAGTAG